MTGEGGSKLETLGLTAEMAAAFDSLAGPDLALGRVTRVERGFANVVTERMEGAFHVPKGLLRESDKRRALDQTPVTGDWVVVSTSRQAIERVLPRTTQFVRRAAGKRDEAQVVAANVDVVFLLMGLDGDFNVRRLERYLTLSSESGAKAVVLLTKAGLCSDVPSRVAEVEAVAPGVVIHPIDVVSGIDVDAPLQHVGPGVTAALIGSSGVGKSTLANFLMGTEVAKTREVRAHDERGKHTTSRRELYLLGGGGIVIDTPGMRELALWGETKSLDAAFPDVVEIALGCRFSDCAHGTEPGCAVRAAVRDGALEATRLASYQALAAELEDREGARSRRYPRSTDRPPRSRR
ncbi:MAG: ribosome small subunit-dependent GTPase A [Polyangiaceae bacterium]|nr:ribosome small subunit-dependent GTPase A [Polyangiaceae bacterium]